MTKEYPSIIRQSCRGASNLYQNGGSFSRERDFLSKHRKIPSRHRQFSDKRLFYRDSLWSGEKSNALLRRWHIMSILNCISRQRMPNNIEIRRKSHYRDYRDKSLQLFPWRFILWSLSQSLILIGVGGGTFCRAVRLCRALETDK